MRRAEKVEKVTLLAASIGLAAISVTATAQETTGGSTVAGTVEEVLVTARKKTESAQDIPISLTVVGSESLENKSVVNFSELASQSPALRITGAALSPSSTVLSMRGQVLVDTRLTVDPAIGIYQDGVYFPRAAGTEVSELFDIDRVEVLSGPQGTLYGKNTTGGAINIYTKAPVQKNEGALKVRYGNFNDTGVAAMYNAAVNDQLAIRFVGSVTEREGYGDNRFNGSKLGSASARSLRLAVAWTPTDDVSLTFRGDYAHSDATGPAWKGFYTLLSTSPLITAACVERGNPVANCVSGATRADTEALLRSYRNSDFNNGSSNVQPDENFDVWGASVTLDWDLTQDISLKSITAVRGFERTSAVDLDGTPFQLLEYPRVTAKDEAFSEELQLLGTSFDKRLDWIVGAYYSHESGDEDITQRSIFAINPAGLTHQVAPDVTNKSAAAFVQGTYKITDPFSVTAGVRYTKDDRSLTASNYNNTTCQSLGVALSTLPNLGACRVSRSVDFDQVSYTFGLNYQIAEDVLLYAKTNKGYRAGGLQQTAGGTTPIAAATLSRPFQPETLQDYEAGIKAVWWDRHVVTNISVFHAELDDAIRTVSQQIPGTNTAGTLNQNAAKAKIDGVEAELRFIPNDVIELALTGSYLDASFDKYVTPLGEDRSNLPLLFTPKYQYGASVTLRPVSQWTNQIDWAWRDKQLTAEVNAYAPANGILNARSTYHFEDSDLDLAVYGKNLTEERYYSYPVDVVAGLGLTYSSFANPPRTYGVELLKRF